MACEIELEIGSGPGPDQYVARVVHAASGGEPTAIMQLDVDRLLGSRDELETTVLASSVAARRAVPVGEQKLRDVGRELFDSLFAGSINGAYRASMGVAQQRGERLRVVLRLTAPKLAALPWEALFDSDTEAYICRKEPLVRHVPAPYTRDPLEVRAPLKVLGLVASPRGLPALDVVAEQERLAEALAAPIAQGLVELHWLSQATWAGVQAKLLSDEWHVLHFIGHGAYDLERDQGQIALVDDQGRADLVDAESLADLLGEAQPSPRLVVLNSCSSGESGTQDLFSGTAAALVRSGISAVAAMQFTVSDTAALAFARGFYTALAHGRNVDEATRSGRISMLGARGTLEWVTPVLYVRGDETRLFDLAPQEAAGRDTRRPVAGKPGESSAAHLHALYVQARAELRAGNHETAAGLFDDLLTMDPSYRDAAGLRATANQELMLAQDYQQAVDAEKSGDWATAMARYSAVIETHPEYRDAAARRQACERAQRIADLKDEMRYLAGAAEWQAVLDVGEDLAATDPSAADPEGLVSRAREALRATAEAAQVEHRGSPARRSEHAEERRDAAQIPQIPAEGPRSRLPQPSRHPDQSPPPSLGPVTQIPLDSVPSAIAVGGGSTWVQHAYSTQFLEGRLARIDSHTRHLVKEVDAALPLRLRAAFGQKLHGVVANADHVWVVLEAGGRGVIYVAEMSAEGELTGKRVAVGKIPWTGTWRADMSLTSTSLWLTMSHIGVVVVHLASGALTTIPVGGEPVSIVADGDVGWVWDASDGCLVRVDPERLEAPAQRIKIGTIIDPPNTLASCAGLLVAAQPDRVTIVDPDRPEEIGSVAFDDHPNVLCAVDGRHVCVVSGDGTVSWLDPRAAVVTGTGRNLGHAPLAIAAGNDAIWVATAKPAVAVLPYAPVR